MNRQGDQPSRLKIFSLYHLPVLLYGVGVLGLSSIPNLSTPGLEFAFSDKLAHLLEYAVFAALLFRSLAHLAGRTNSNPVLVRVAIYLALFAIADEILLQRFVPGRHSDLYDLLSDWSGVCLGLAGARIYLWYKSGSVV